MTRHGRVRVPATLPLWRQPSSTFGLLSVTMCIARSPGFAISSILAPRRLGADSDRVPSRCRRQSADCGSMVRRLCTRRSLPAHLRRIPLRGQRVVSSHNAKHNNDEDDFMSQPPPDPDVRHARLRFLKQRCYCPDAVPWCPVGRVGALSVSPLCPTSGCAARRRLPSRGSRGPHVPTFAGTLRRDDCPLSLAGASRVARLPETVPAAVFVVSHKGSWSRGSPRPRQGLWSPGPLLRAGDPGDRWLAHVPACPLWRHAPLSDPGGVLDTRHPASRTAAFRRVHTVGVPRDFFLRALLVVYDSPHFGAQSRGLRPCSTRLRTAPDGEARGFATDRLARH